MHLHNVSIDLMELPLRDKYGTSRGESREARSIVMRVELGEFEGWGEVTPMAGFSTVTPQGVVDEVSQALLHNNGFREDAEIEALGDVIRFVSDLESLLSAESRSMVEMALLDALSRSEGRPLYEVLGGRTEAHPVELVGWIGTGNVTNSVESAKQIVGQGFNYVKLKVGADWRSDVERTLAVRNAVPEAVRLRLDANGAYSVAEATCFVRAIEGAGIEVLEDPLRELDVRKMSELRSAGTVPLGADEAVRSDSAIRQLEELGVVDVVKLKASKLGGVCAILHCSKIAHRAGIRCVVGHGFGSALGMLAEIHAVAASEIVEEGCEAVGALKLSSQPFLYSNKLSPSMRLGYIPGIGVSPNHTKRTHIKGS